MKKVEGLDAQVFVWGFAPETCLRMSTADLAMGAIIGHVEIIDCVQESDSEWFVGPYGFVLRDPVPVDPIKMRGRLKFWRMP
jgi:hypothetical protein